MEQYIKTIAELLRTSSETIADMERRMSAITGKSNVLSHTVEEIQQHEHRMLDHLGVTKDDDAGMIQDVLLARVKALDNQLLEVLDGTGSLPERCKKLCEIVEDVGGKERKHGYFIKYEKAVELLSKNPPPKMMEHFGYANVQELVNKEGLESVYAALRFMETNEWMHAFFGSCYNDLTADDFEEREVKFIVLDKKWVDAAQKFLEKKYHRVSHLKELGIIFVVPLELDESGGNTRMLSLLLHYSNEVPFYSKLFRKFSSDDDFAEKIQSLLRGDVPEEKIVFNEGVITWRIVQRYLAKDDRHDFRLFEPHVNPEGEHWYLAEQDLYKIPSLSPEYEKLDFPFWRDLDFVGGLFKTKGEVREEDLVSFDLIDTLMSLVRKGKYLYHQQEALWNKIFIEYMGREEMSRLVDENIIEGFITLKK